VYEEYGACLYLLVRLMAGLPAFVKKRKARTALDVTVQRC
jgi:hypothetical protein